MKKTLAALLILSASAAQAGHLDVISFTLNDKCTLGQYLEVVEDFNEWGSTYGYQTEIAVPSFSDNLETIYWLGRSANAEAFGKAHDAWEAAQTDANSVPARLMQRFGECGGGNDTRRAYRTFP